MSALNGPCVKAKPNVLSVINFSYIPRIFREIDYKLILYGLESFSDRMHLGLIAFLSGQQ